ncbi:MAG: hypothetical protein DRP79_07085 [Planctomycetota bacterium]|nr:MAG: hypothetical protein DRP79_07085 [Planctomycetota bacterium]
MKKMPSTKRHIVLLPFALITCAALATGSAYCANPDGPPPEPRWHYRAKLTLPLAKKSNKPMLLTLSYAGDLRSWELRRSVFASDKFRAVADNFVLCRDAINRDDLKGLGIKIEGKDLGGIIFLSPDGKEMERVRWTGDPGLALSVIQRVASGNSIGRLRARIAKDPSDVESLQMLYGAYAEKRRAGLALEILENLKSSDKENKKEYEALAGYWGAVLLIEKRQWAEALKEIERALPLVEARAVRDDLVVLKANVTYRMGKKADGISQLRKFISENPGSPSLETAYRELITMLNRAGRPGEMTTTALEALQALPENRFAIKAIFNLAHQLFRRRHYKESRELFRLIAGRVPGSANSEQADILYRAMTFGADWKKRLARRREVPDVLYIVPDTATLLYYVSLWDEKTYFPVLVNSGSERDKRLMEKFAAAFKPSRIIMTPSRKGIKADEATALKAVLTSWNADDLDSGVEATRKAIKKELRRLNIAPMGIVFTETNDDGFLAGGVALAAGRFELLDFLQAPGGISKNINDTEVKKLREELVGKIKAWGYDYRRVFDDIDFVTIAFDMPLKYKAHFHLYCVDDFITRRDDEIRYAYPGRLMEGVTRANYMAMCSLFLQPKKALFFNAYKASGGGFAAYRTDGAARAMKKIMPTADIEGKDANLKKWRELTGRVNTFGYLHVNSAGGKDIWWVGGAKGRVNDIPSESVACVIHMTHSYSAAEPWNPATIAGRWLRAGAYIYYGSTYEPFLQAFRTPTRIAVAIGEREPLSMAYRSGFGEQFWTPWRLCYFGDPMYLLGGKQPPRAKAEDVEIRKGEREFKKLSDMFKNNSS